METPAGQNVILLEKIRHKNNLVIGMKFEFSSSLNHLVKSLNGAWSNSIKCWHLPYNPENLEKVCTTFKEHAQLVMGESFNDSTDTIINMASVEASCSLREMLKTESKNLNTGFFLKDTVRIL